MHVVIGEAFSASEGEMDAPCDVKFRWLVRKISPHATDGRHHSCEEGNINVHPSAELDVWMAVDERTKFAPTVKFFLICRVWSLVIDFGEKQSITAISKGEQWEVAGEVARSRGWFTLLFRRALLLLHTSH